MQRAKPPFRADHVGSLLRPPALKEAREKREKGAITPAQLKAIEDQEIRQAISKQEEVGLSAITDGEFRRAYWHFDFLENLTGCEGYWMEPQTIDARTAFKGATLRPWMVRVIGKLDFPATHPHIEHFKFLKANTSRTPKAMIPSASMLNYRGGRSVVSEKVYPNLDNYYADLAQAYGKAIKAFYDAGCRYLQIDDVAFAYFCDGDSVRCCAIAATIPTGQFDLYRDVFNTALKTNRPTWSSRRICAAAISARPSWAAAATSRSPTSCSMISRSTAIFSNGIRTGLAGSSRCVAAQGPQDRRARADHIQERQARGQGTRSSAGSRKPQICVARPALPVTAMRICVDRGRQHALRYDEQWAKLARVVEIAREVWG